MVKRPGTGYILLLGFSLAILHMPSGIPAPFYPLFERDFDIGSTTIGLFFGTYILGVVLALIGSPKVALNRFVLLFCCALSIVGSLVLMAPKSVPEIYLGHFIHGLVLGVVTVVVPVVLGRIDFSGTSKIAGRITTSANAIGLLAGPLWSGLLLYLLPEHKQLVWWIQIAVTLVVMPFLVLDRDVLRIEVQVESALPVERWKAFFTHPATIGAMLVGSLAFGSGGLLAALGSVLTNTVMQESNAAIQGLVTSLCFIVSAITGAVYLKWSDNGAMIFGTFLIGLGAAGLGAAIVLANLPVLMLAAAICGAGQGFGLQGAIQAVAHQSSAGQASKSVSAFFLMSYSGTILSSFGVAGLISVSDLATASTVFCAGVVAICLMTTGLLLRNRATRYATS